MRELRRVVASGELGEILHVEGHYSNENSGAHFSQWRTSPSEAPGAGMTGSGIHVLDALCNLLGPVARVQTQVITRKPAPDPTDTLSIMFEFENHTSALLGAVRATPFYWRIHVFGREASVEALGETELVIRRKGAKPEHFSYDPLDSLKEEFDVFADAVAGHSEYPIKMPHMVNVVAAFEAIVQSIETGQPVSLIKA